MKRFVHVALNNFLYASRQQDHFYLLTHSVNYDVLNHSFFTIEAHHVYNSDITNAILAFYMTYAWTDLFCPKKTMFHIT